MQLISGTWTGALISADGRQETAFSLSQPGPHAAHIGQGFGMPLLVATPAMTLDGGAPTSMRLLDGARNALVALADAVPDPASGTLAQLLVEVRVLGDRLVGNWLRRDANGQMLSGGTLVAERAGGERASGERASGERASGERTGGERTGAERNSAERASADYTRTTTVRNAA